MGRVASGNPVWEVSDGAIPIGVGRGQRSEISGLIVPPGASIQIDVLAGTPNVAVVGRLVGVQGPDMASIAQAFLPTPNIVAADISSPRTKLTPTALGILTVPGNGIAQTQSFPLPGGTTGLRIFAGNTTPGATITLSVVGDQSGISYWPGVLSGIPFSTNEPLTVPIDNEQDTSVTVSATGSNGGGQWLMSLSALTGAEVVEVRAQHALPVTPSGTFTVQEGASPPLWQAPNAAPKTVDANIGAGGTVSIIGFVAGQQVRLFGVAVTAAAGGLATLNDTGGIELGSVAAGSTWAANFGGVPVFSVAGRGLDMKAPGAATTVNGMVSFSQG